MSDRMLDHFLNPPSRYRGAPFWAWNCALDRERLLRQIAVFKTMGMGGFHIHARTGLATPYLSDAFMELIRACVEAAEREEMLVWLYDEDRWPSGFAGGLVTSEPRFRARQLLFTPFPYGSPDAPADTSGAFGRRAENGVLLARYQVILRDSHLASYRRLVPDEHEPIDGTIWYAYSETMRPSPWYNNQGYVDTLNRDAVERFIAITHERYAQVVGEYFGGVIPAIFTDEPQVVHKQSLAYADEVRDLIIPCTDDFFATYQQTYGHDLADALPEIFWESVGGTASVARFRYHDHLCERFAIAFVDTIGGWCAAHSLALTGHLMDESTLGGQTAALGEVMRAYRGFGLPGIDVLCDWREYTTIKQAQSATHQFGRPGVLSELYGVTNWDFDFVGHKAQGDWQAALGVTMRVHHLAWLSMAGEAKRDYPASICYQSPWWYEYPLIEDYFARINTVLTRGKVLVRVGVIHPIESYWLCCGPIDQTATERERCERIFADVTNWLLFGLIDFDFIAESLLPELSPIDDSQPAFVVGEMHYDVIIVPALRTIRSTTLERLEYFARTGGTIIFAGELPSLVDALPSERAHELAARCVTIELVRKQLLDALVRVREIEILLPDGHVADSILHQFRVEDEQRYLFLCNTDRERARQATQIKLRGDWNVTVLETLNGTSYWLQSRLERGWTVIDWDFVPHSSLLLALEAGWKAGGIAPMRKTWTECGQIVGPVPITLSEPNVVLLDQATYRLNDEPWLPVEEILRIDTLLRRRLGFPLRTDEMAQPWSLPSAPTIDTLSLAFELHLAIDLAAPMLALEDAAQITISLDGQSVPSQVSGWFVDEAIETVALPPLCAGVHELVLTRPFGSQTNLEWYYLLGDFGVEVRGRHAWVVAPVRELAFGDWTAQGLPFYAGNVTYHCTLAGDGEERAIHIPTFRAPLLSVALDGQTAGKIAFAPFQVELGTLSVGEHTLDITAYGNRVNTFGALHNADPRTIWFGPPAWRTQGEAWSYEYQLKPMGVLVAPEVLQVA